MSENKLRLYQLDSGNATNGQALVWDAASLSWLPGAGGGGSALPSQTNNSGKFLITDGNVTSWANAVTSVTVVSSDLIVTNPTITTSGNITLELTASGITAGTYKSVTVDSKGRVTAGSNPTTLAGYGITDAFSGSYADLTNKPTLFSGSFADLTNKPTTLSGYGITNGVTLTGTETLTNKTLTAPAVNSPKVKGEQAVSVSLGTLITGTQNIDLSSAQIFALTVSSAATVTLSFSNTPSSGHSQMVMIQVTNGGAGSIVWPAGTKFSGGTAPILTPTGVDLVGVFYNSFLSSYVVFLLGRDIK